jgi:CDP-2,3-bis-(O-geranylgeranyl)-sn-glycerol synthase
LFGDIIGSFIKRRFGLKRGDPAPVLDQVDFALMASLYYWFTRSGFAGEPYFILYSLLLILFLHILTNNIAYYLGVKDRRW